MHFVDEFDAHASPLGATGLAAAVANAVFHAAGKRIQSRPITPANIV
jgi:xanthine dehydrogenase YagR molybdenum-binding subunit